jgi:DNA-binding NarL/FixJ family response regulator
VSRKKPVLAATFHATGASRADLPGQSAVRVCIVYEHSLFAYGIKNLLEQQTKLRMVGMIERPRLSLRALKRHRPDVVVVEGDGGMAILESLEGLMGVAISLRGEEATIFTGLPIKVSGPDELANAIKAVAREPHRRLARRTTP